MLAGVAPSARLPPARPAGRRRRAGEGSGTASAAETQRRGDSSSPAAHGASRVRAGCGEGAARSAQAARSPARLRCPPRPRSPAPAGPCKQNPLSPSRATAWPRVPGLLGLTRHRCLAPAGPPAASAPRRRGRRRTARAPGTLGHSAAPPRSLGGRQPSAAPARHPPQGLLGSALPVHAAPLPRTTRT